MSDSSASALDFGVAEQLAAMRLIELAISEDLGDAACSEFGEVFSMTTVDAVLDDPAWTPPSELDRDLTCAAIVDRQATATIQVVARREGVLSGGPIGELVFSRLDSSVVWQMMIADGTTVSAGKVIAQVSGPLRSLLIGERTVLNFMTHLSGVATHTRQFVDAIAGTKSVILDTRKTLPGWRALEKYAVRCGGGTNHRLGLHDGVLIKDNHLAAWVRRGGASTIADAVRQARNVSLSGIAIEVEVDSLEQLRDALSGGPEIVLLDNMGPPMLREAVQLRDQVASATQLEASGGITLGNVREIAETGVDRISIGALTHSAPALDIAFDWPV